LPEWLKTRAIEHGDSREALNWAQKLFWQRPALDGYEEVKALSETLGTWETLQAEILSRLSRQNQHALLTSLLKKARSIKHSSRSGAASGTVECEGINAARSGLLARSSRAGIYRICRRSRD
jgi:hypothetical protein